MAKFTPGPWEYGWVTTSMFKISNKKGTIATGIFKKSDAQLMTAAPEMHKALKRLEQEMETYDIENNTYFRSEGAELARLALLKAEGREE